MEDQRTVTVTVIEDDDLAHTQPLDVFFSRLQAARDLIPEDYRAAATIEIRGSWYEDCADVSMAVYYARPETDAERKAREDHQAMLAVAAEHRKRATAVSEARAAWNAAWWADRDPVNYSRFANVLRGIWPDLPDLGCRQAFHHQAERINAGAKKPHWWVDAPADAES